MNSRVVNKLIRSEIWPVLRAQGFSRFDSRNAWRYREPLVDVVNFQSFNSYLAEGIGCTTYSFALHLGVYVLGSLEDPWIKKDSSGRPLPHEAQCSFRAHIEKRSPIDGFARADVFYIDREGHSAGAVFKEVRDQLKDLAPRWFGALANLNAVVAWMSGGDPPPGLPEQLGPGVYTGPGSLVWHDLFAVLRLLTHSATPTRDFALDSIRDIDAVIGSIQEIFSPILSTPASIDFETRRSRDLLLRLGEWRPNADLSPSVLRERSRLFASTWSAGSRANTASHQPAATVTPRSGLWPSLRKLGFSEFTDRLAHRPTREGVHVVSFAPPDPRQRKQYGYSRECFRIGVGVFWPDLSDGSPVRTNRRDEARPKLEECHLQMWLTSDNQASVSGPTTFITAADALTALDTDGAAWFSLCENTRDLAHLLEFPDWKILANYPTMRGFGSKNSVPRFLLRSVLAHRQGNAGGTQAFLEEARKAVMSVPEFRRDYLHRWVDQVTANLYPT